MKKSALILLLTLGTNGLIAQTPNIPAPPPAATKETQPTNPAADTAFTDLQNSVQIPRGQLAGLTREEGITKLKTHCQSLYTKRTAFITNFPNDPRAAEIKLAILDDNTTNRKLGLPSVTDKDLMESLKQLTEDTTTPPSTAAKASSKLLTLEARKLNTAELTFAEWNTKVDTHLKNFPDHDNTTLKLKQFELALHHDPATSEIIHKQLTDPALPLETIAKATKLYSQSEFDKAQALIKTDPDLAEIKLTALAKAGFENAAAALQQLASVQKMTKTPLDITFTDIHGAEVSLAKLKGKVVLIDFWATWCGPCVAEMPRVKEVYEKFHDRGFEIIGISLDTDPEAVKAFVKASGLPWPQYCPPAGTANTYAEEYKISAIPTMWLIGKNGLLTDIDARSELPDKVEFLLKHQ